MRRFLFRQKYRFDMASQFMSFINFALLVLTASDKLRAVIPLPSWAVVALGIPLALICVWALGYVLDRYFQYAHAMNTELMTRNPLWDQQMEVLHRIESKMACSRCCPVVGAVVVRRMDSQSDQLSKDPA